VLYGIAPSLAPLVLADMRVAVRLLCFPGQCISMWRSREEELTCLGRSFCLRLQIRSAQVARPLWLYTLCRTSIAMALVLRLRELFVQPLSSPSGVRSVATVVI
jgi:hypothetical protein